MTESAACGAGQALRSAREARGLTIADVAQQLKFAPRQLQALEDERYEALPGVAIARGMVRNYARLLNLDAEPLVTQVAQRMQVPDTNLLAARYSAAVPFTEGGRRSNAVYLTVSIAILALVGGVAYEWYRERNRPAPLAFVAPPSVAPVSAPLAVPLAAPEPEPEPAATLVAATPPPPAVEVPKAPASHRLVFRFEREAWIEVRDGAGRLLLAQLAPEGAERVVQGRAPFALVIGNAQHVRLSMDEKPVDLKRHTRTDVARFQLP